MKWKVEFRPSVVKDFKKLPKEVVAIIKQAINEKLKIDPISFGKHLRNEWAGYKSFRIGRNKYRVIYKVDNKVVTIEIVHAFKRKDGYPKGEV